MRLAGFWKLEKIFRIVSLRQDQEMNERISFSCNAYFTLFAFTVINRFTNNVD